MAMDVWRKEHIRNALAAAQMAHEGVSSSDDPVAQAYSAGFLKALQVVGASFGIRVATDPANRNEVRKLLGPPTDHNGQQP